MNVGGRRRCPDTRTPPPGAGPIGLATTSTRIDGRGERSRSYPPAPSAGERGARSRVRPCARGRGARNVDLAFAACPPPAHRP